METLKKSGEAFSHIITVTTSSPESAVFHTDYEWEDGATNGPFLPQDSPVSQFQAPEKNLHRLIPDGFGPKWSGYFTWFDPQSSCWKTPQVSLVEGWVTFSGTWPRAGTMQNGVCWRQPMWERRISGKGSGFWPTPTASDTRQNDRYGNGSLKLSGAVARWPTPCTKGMCGGTGAFEKMLNLQDAGIITETERKQMTAGNGGQLNPPWTEWLMGYPIGWTALKGSATP
ncbi:MAG: hypothetical protein FE78DRAFT_28365 [Acidomyces sp. 'richmondensis']|nr:MAG: hypothetical protein FE78DRAFT_28365 [Acidomyces sp. 'richmondensis']